MIQKSALLLAVLIHLLRRLPEIPYIYTSTSAVIRLLWVRDIMPMRLQEWAGEGVEILEVLGAWLLLDVGDRWLWHDVEHGADEEDSYSHYRRLAGMIGSAVLLWKFLLNAPINYE
ncbi:uncharacterized protein DMAD_00043 [Drosophila madeirensis]|uniref:Uncharacterized protein n=1 Tax=Drosophila madeirensis TaxID=30013 RepID=A0AAU9FUZ3_DROMD